jgi:signal peptidase II
VRKALFVGLVPVLLALVCSLAVRAGLPSWLALVGLALVAGGGLANWLDRMLHDGAVTDYVSLGVGGLRTGIFNLADLAIVAGVAAFLLAGGAQEPAEPEAEATLDE